METHSNILIWKLAMVKGAWWTTVRILPKLDTAEQLNTVLKVE